MDHAGRINRAGFERLTEWDAKPQHVAEFIIEIRRACRNRSICKQGFSIAHINLLPAQLKVAIRKPRGHHCIAYDYTAVFPKELKRNAQGGRRDMETIADQLCCDRIAVKHCADHAGRAGTQLRHRVKQMRRIVEPGFKSFFGCFIIGICVRSGYRAVCLGPRGKGIGALCLRRHIHQTHGANLMQL